MKVLSPVSAPGHGTRNMVDKFSSSKRRDGWIDEMKRRTEQKKSLNGTFESGDLPRHTSSQAKFAVVRPLPSLMQTVPPRKSVCSIQLQRPGFPEKGLTVLILYLSHPSRARSLFLDE